MIHAWVDLVGFSSNPLSTLVDEGSFTLCANALVRDLIMPWLSHNSIKRILPYDDFLLRQGTTQMSLLLRTIVRAARPIVSKSMTMSFRPITIAAATASVTKTTSVFASVPALAVVSTTPIFAPLLATATRAFAAPAAAAAAKKGSTAKKTTTKATKAKKTTKATKTKKTATKAASTAAATRAKRATERREREAKLVAKRAAAREKAREKAREIRKNKEERARERAQKRRELLAEKRQNAEERRRAGIARRAEARKAASASRKARIEATKARARRAKLASKFTTTKRIEAARGKRPVTAFAIYLKQMAPQRPSDVAPAEYVKTIAAKWNTLNDAEKRPFSVAAAESKAATTARREKVPKRPASGFLRFYAEHRAKNNITITSLADARSAVISAGQAWRSLSPNERDTYNRAAKTEFDAYKTKLAKILDKEVPLPSELAM